MVPRARRRWQLLIPAVLFVAAAAALVVLVARSAATERAAVDRTERTRLRGLVSDALGRLARATAALEGRLARGDNVAEMRAGHFVEPHEPTAIPALRTLPGRDPEGDFYLSEATRAEAAAGDLERAEELYGVASTDRRDESVRALARFRLAALTRRRGDDGNARRIEVEFLSALPVSARTTIESLVVRARLRPVDESLERDLLSFVGGPDDVLAVGLLRDAAIADDPAFAARKLDLDRIARLRRLLAKVGVPASGDRFVTLAEDGSRQFIAVGTTESGGVIVRLAESETPEWPIGVQLQLDDIEPPNAEIVESETVNTLRPGARIVAHSRELDVVREADRRVLTLWIGFGVVIAGGGLALFLTARAVHRESEAARVRADFVARVSHDLRTPLSVIRMYAETLASGKVTDPGQAREFAETAAREAERLTGLVARVLDFSRSTDPARRAPVTIDARELVRTAAERQREAFGRAGLSLAVTLPHEPVPILGDADSVESAIFNLLDNARCHAAEGGEAEISLQVHGDVAEMTVSDRGPGLPPEPVEGLFEPFARGSNARSRGFGLGLAVVREVARVHGGSVSASNRNGGGAAFTFRLPLSSNGRAT